MRVEEIDFSPRVEVRVPHTDASTPDLRARPIPPDPALQVAKLNL